MTKQTYAEATDREERTAALLRQLEQGVQAIQTGADFRRYLAVAARFHAYSLNNVLLIQLQRPDATRVAGYKTWLSLGRQVQKGEQGIMIFAPRPYRVRDAAEHDGDEADHIRIAFRAVAVFDIAQTTGEPLPTFTIDRLTGECDGGLYAALLRFAEAEGLRVTNLDVHGHDDQHTSYNGYYSRTKRLIFVRPMSPLHMAKTLIHELAHHLDDVENETHAGERETVAEAVAFVVAAHFGLDTGSYSFPYVAWWAGKQDGTTPIKAVMGRVQTIAHRLIDAVKDDDRRPPLGAAATLLEGARLAA